MRTPMTGVLHFPISHTPKPKCPTPTNVYCNCCGHKARTSGEGDGDGDAEMLCVVCDLLGCGEMGESPQCTEDVGRYGRRQHKPVVRWRERDREGTAPLGANTNGSCSNRER